MHQTKLLLIYPPYLSGAGAPPPSPPAGRVPARVSHSGLKGGGLKMSSIFLIFFLFLASIWVKTLMFHFGPSSNNFLDP